MSKKISEMCGWIGMILIPEEKSKPVKIFFDSFNSIILKLIDLIKFQKNLPQVVVKQLVITYLENTVFCLN